MGLLLLLAPDGTAVVSLPVALLLVVSCPSVPAARGMLMVPIGSTGRIPTMGLLPAGSGATASAAAVLGSVPS
jgi:hypothetical protein